MSGTPPIDPTVGPGSSTVEHDRPCTRCSYNLRGLSIDGPCPECGTPVRESLKGILLQYASPKYLAAIGGGLSMVLTGILIMVAAALATPALFSAGARPTSALFAIQLVQLVTSGLIIFGYWRYTEPDPGFVGEETPGSARKVIRITVSISAGSLIARTVCLWITQTVGRVAGVAEVAQAASIVYNIAWAVQYFPVMRYTRWIARRVPDSYIVRRTKVYIWLLPALSVVSIVAIVIPIVAVLTRTAPPASVVSFALAGALAALVALILYWNLLDRLRKHVKSIRRTGEPAKLRNMAG